MKKIVASLCCILSMTQAIEIDVPFVKQQALANHNDIDSRLLLMKYYWQNHDYDVAEGYMNEVLALDSAHVLAHKIKKRLNFIKRLQRMTGLNNGSSSKMLESLYGKKAYKEFCDLSQKAKHLGIVLDASIDSKMADAYFKMGEHDKSLALMQAMKDKTQVEALKEKIALEKAQKKLESDVNAHTLQEYIYLLKKKKEPIEVISALKTIVKKHPKNADARIALAENIYWQGDVKKAFHTLYSVRQHNRHSRKLYATILYEMGDYAHALYYLPDLLKEESDAKERALLEKRVALSYLHTGKKQEAEQLFTALLKKYSHDNELQRIQQQYKKEQLLSQAVAFHKRKDFGQALRYYLSYHDKSREPKIAKEIAEIYYFSKRQKLALPYFEEYLEAFPADTLIRFHYASVFEKLKNYEQSAREFRKIIQKPNSKEYYLAQYHYANALMHTYKDADWLEARELLVKLVNSLEMRGKIEEKSLLKFSKNLLKMAKGPIKKPTRYKDIILTEGSYKQVDPKEVFSIANISFSTKPDSIASLVAKEKKKLKAWLGMDYVEDSASSYTNYKIGFDNIITQETMQLGVEFQNFNFDGLNRDYAGMALFVNAEIERFKISLGVEHFEDFDTFVPKVSWNTALGNHHLFMDATYRNGAFVNYRNCMVENELNVYHVGLYDNYLLEDLSTLSAGLDINYFEDDNTNLYGQVTLPLFSYRVSDIEHKVLLNENIEYNTKTEVCAHPTKLYDSSYLKYEPKVEFGNGYLQGSFGGGYGFKNQEALFSYGVNAAYNIVDVATFALNCERLQSSFTGDEMTFCHLDIMQTW